MYPPPHMTCMYPPPPYDMHVSSSFTDKERMEQDNLAKLEALVVKHKDDLWWYWTHVEHKAV